MKEGWIKNVKNDTGVMNEEWWMMKDDDFKLLRGFDNRQTDRRTDEQTFVNVELLSQLKNENYFIKNDACKTPFFKCNISIFCWNEIALININYLPITPWVPDDEKFMDKAMYQIHPLPKCCHFSNFHLVFYKKW